MPDLYLEPDAIVFYVAGTPTRGAPIGTAQVNITVYVGDKGPGNITSANVTLDLNGTLFGVSPVLAVSIEGTPALVAYFLWSTGTLSAGEYPFRAQVNDSAGDEYPADNVAYMNFTVGPRAPSLKLRLDAAIVEAEVSVSAPAMVTLTGNVGGVDLYGQVLSVNVTSGMDTGWISQASPSTVVFIEDNTISFSVTVVVPQATRADPPGILTVSASARALDLDLTASATALVTVKPYFGIELDSDAAYKEIAPGDSCTFTVKLTNKGNANDSFSLEVRNLNDLVADREMATLSRLTLDKVRPGEYASFDVVFRSSEDWTLWKSEPTVIVIKATSLGAQQYKQVITQHFLIYAYEKGSYPAWYNWTTIGLAIVMVAAVAVAGFWMWRRKKRKTGEPGNRDRRRAKLASAERTGGPHGTGEPGTESREAGKPEK